MTDVNSKPLVKSHLFTVLSQEEIEQLASSFDWQLFPEGTYLTKQGLKHPPLFVIATGTAQVVVTRGEAQIPVPVKTLVPGETFGFVSFFTGQPSDTSIRCLEDCEVLVMEEQAFRAMLDRWPVLYKTFIEELSNLLNGVNKNLRDTLQKEFLRSGLQANQFRQKFYALWGGSKTTKGIEKIIEEFARLTEPLLLMGERGTGRQMIAWEVHITQFGESAPFIVVDGRNSGDEWSASLEVADGGTLFVKEINLLSEAAQLRLLSCRLNGNCNFRLVGSLVGEADRHNNGWLPQFRELFQVSYNIKPLRDRKRDIPPLAQGVLEKLAIKNETPVPQINQEAMKLLLSHNYRQGNVTELIQVMERAFLLVEANTVGLEQVFFGPTAERLGQSINLLEWSWIAETLKKGTLVLWLRRIMVTSSFIVLGLLFFAPDTLVGHWMFPLVWGLGWPILALVSPSLGRVICCLCPVSHVMNFAQRKLHFNLPVPNWMNKYDYLITATLFAFVFWLESVTIMRSSPFWTGILFSTIMILAIIVGIIYTRHTWCRHLCPLGNFIGMASIGSSLEVRSDNTVCLNKCTTFDCYKGSGDIPGCPMSMHVPYVDNNLDCKMCFNCIRNCPNGAVQFNLRIPAREVWHMVRVNQGYVVFIGVALAILVPTIYFHPLRNVWPIGEWRLIFSQVYWTTAILAGALTWWIVRPFRTKAASRRVKLAFAMIPLILGGYIMFQIGFLPGAHSLMLGLGWKTPEGTTLPFFIPALLTSQTAAIVIGIILSSFAVVMVLNYHHKQKNIAKKEGQ